MSERQSEINARGNRRWYRGTLLPLLFSLSLLLLVSLARVLSVGISRLRRKYDYFASLPDRKAESCPSHPAELRYERKTVGAPFIIAISRA